jgi:hypothetical protein
MEGGREETPGGGMDEWMMDDGGCNSSIRDQREKNDRAMKSAFAQKAIFAHLPSFPPRVPCPVISVLLIPFSFCL